MLKKHILGFVITSIIFIGILSIQTSQVDSDDLLLIETWITGMTWDIYESIYQPEISQFSFDFDFNIYNPNNENITLYFNDSKQFAGNFSAELEDNNHNASC